MTKILMKLLFLIGTLFSIFFLANLSLACSCAVGGTVEDAYSVTPNVVVLKVDSVERSSNKEQSLGLYGIVRSSLTVEKVFKGNLKVGQSLLFRQGGGADCVWAFDEDNVGNEYLLFLNAKPDKDGLWTGNVCSRSKSTKFGAVDLRYLEKRSKVLGKTRISGRLSQEFEAAQEGEVSKDQLLANHALSLTGNGKELKLRTDENGVYEFYDLLPGKYELTPEAIPGYKLNEASVRSVDIVLKAGGQIEQDFNFVVDNVIQGKVVDSKGNTLESVCLDLLPAQGSIAQYFRKFDCTEADGSFELKEIPTGNYVIVVNEEGKISARQPFGRFYYPGTKVRSEAGVLFVGPGQSQKGLVLAAPDTAETIVVDGVLLFSDGKPVAKTFVMFYVDDDPPKSHKIGGNEDSQAVTDTQGRFRIRILKGQKGSLIGGMFSFVGKFEKCPLHDKLLKDTEGHRGGSVETPPILIDATTDITGIELRLPFPSCKLAEIN